MRTFFNRKSKPKYTPLDVSFSESVLVAMSFVFDTMSERLPKKLLKEARLRETLFFGHPLVRMSEVKGIENKGAYHERYLDFYFGDQKRWVDVYLRKGKEPDAKWRVMCLTYDMWQKASDPPYGLGAGSLGRYLLIVEPHDQYIASGFLWRD